MDLQKVLNEINAALMEVPVSSNAFKHLAVARMEIIAVIQRRKDSE